MSDPWIVHAETALPKDGTPITSNPTTFISGLVGEASLPYTVPEGKQLIVDYVSIESIWGAAIWLWLGSGAFDADPTKVIHTFTSDGLNITTGSGPQTGIAAGPLPGTREWHPRLVLPAGAILNVAMAAWHQNADGWIYGWIVSGELVDAI